MNDFDVILFSLEKLVKGEIGIIEYRKIRGTFLKWLTADEKKELLNREFATGLMY